jgi:septum formation protein
MKIDGSRTRIILASGSPRRRELLAGAGIEFDVVESGVSEVRRAAESPADYASRLASDKAMAVSRENRDALVIGADTIVVLGEDILEKPASADEARTMLRRLSANIHTVITAIALARDGVTIEVAPVTSRVRFREISDDEIDDYIATGEPFDKAGAYGIQAGGGSFIVSVEGGRDTVMGLPVADVVAAIARAANDR